MLKSATFIAAGLVAFTTFAVQAQDASRDTVVATVNGVDITLGQMIIARAQLPQQYQQLPDDVMFSGLLDQLIQQQLLAEEVNDVPDRVNIALENDRRSLLAGEAINDLTKDAATDEAVQIAYDEAIAAMPEVTEYNAAHVLVATEDEAKAVIGRLEAGEDFAIVAKEVSTDTGSGAMGGDLGWFSAGMMVPEFETAVIALEAGALSAPVESQFGWHVIKLNESRVKPAPTLDEMRDEIVGKIQQDAITAHLDELTNAAAITRPEDGAFDPAILKNLDLLDQ